MFPFDPPENIRKVKVFWCFQGEGFLMFSEVSKGNIEKKRVKVMQKNQSWPLKISNFI